MSYLRIWLHCVWTTKDRIPYLRDQIRYEVISHICENAQLKGIYIDHINGHYEHLHALISLGGKQNPSDIMQKIKGESSRNRRLKPTVIYLFPILLAKSP